MASINDELRPKDEWFRHTEIDFNFRKGEFNFAYRNLNSTIEIKDENIIPEWNLYDPIFQSYYGSGKDGKEILQAEEYKEAEKMKKDFDLKWNKRKVEILKLAHNILVAEANTYLNEYKELTEKIKSLAKDGK
jgi:hypothetical protein